MCAICEVAGIVQLTAGCDSAKRKKNCAQFSQPNSTANAGIAMPRTAANDYPPSKGRLLMAATPRSAHSGSRRSSAELSARF
jgi:hypothetical protein